MTDIINLNRQRKAKARIEKEKTASQNRVKFGRTKAQKKLEQRESEKAGRHLAGHKRDKPEE